MSDKKSIDKFARGIALVSLLVAIAAIAVPYIEQRRQFRVLQTEQLAIHLNPHADGPFRITKHNFGPMGRVVQFPWQVTLANTGNQKLSITEYSITSGIRPDTTFYSGIDGGMLKPNQDSVDLPLTLDPGESRQFVVLIGIMVTPKVHDILASIKDPKLRTVGYATKALARRGLDIYGNEVTYREYVGGAYQLTVAKENQKSPTFWYRAVSGRGNVFLASAATYEGPE
jgi:hypothetical protein